jgi:pre-rRNA-processing protein IPI1
MVRQAASKVKKKPGDFKRPKRKVGRKAAPAANVTNVSIASKRINLLEQSALQEKGEAVTHRHLNLSDLVQQLGHYNAHMRKNGLQGLRELAKSHTSTVLANVSIVLERFLPLIADEEAIVREAALCTWKVLVPAMMTGKSLKPFSKLISMYFCSGLTHLQVGVRQDTLKAIGLVLETAPELVSLDAGLDQFGRLIENFRDLITAAQAQGIKMKNTYDLLSNGKSDARTSKKAAASALTLRFAALKVLHQLLRCIRSDTSMNEISSCNRRTIPSGSVKEMHTLLLYPTPMLVSVNDSEKVRNATFWQEKSRCLVAPLMDLWMECLGNHPSLDTLTDEYLEHMNYIVESITIIVRENQAALIAAEASDDNDDDAVSESSSAIQLLQLVSKRVREQLLQQFPLFPTSALDDTANNTLMLTKWLEINISLSKFICELLHFPSISSVRRTTSCAKQPKLQDQIVHFISSIFGRYLSSDALRGLPTTHQIIRSLLETFTLFLGVLCRDGGPEKASIQATLFDAFTLFYVKCSPRTVTFRICSEFVIDHLTTHRIWPDWNILVQWVQCFGKLIGSLEVSQMNLCRACLFVLIDIMKRLPLEFQDKPEIQNLMKNLIGFFTLSSSDSTTTTIAKLSDLNKENQTHFVSLLYHLLSYPTELLRALASCMKSCHVCVDAKSFMLDILHQRKEFLDLAPFLSLLMSCVFSKEALEQDQSTKHLQIVQHVCRILNSMNLGESLSKMLTPVLTKQLEQMEKNTLCLKELHALVLCYGICLKAATTAASVSSIDEQILEDISRICMYIFLLEENTIPTKNVPQQQQQQQQDIKALQLDLMQLFLYGEKKLFLQVLSHLLCTKESSSDNVQRRFKALQLWLKLTNLSTTTTTTTTTTTSTISSRTSSSSNSSLNLTLLWQQNTVFIQESIETLVTQYNGTKKKEIQTLHRQILGDLTLLSTGSI